jgi:hypothetical protein
MQSILGLAGTKVAIGSTSGLTNQGSGAVAVGNGTGSSNQGSQSIAIGYVAGYTNQGANSVAIGSNAAQSGQGVQSVALGYAANSAVNNATALGANASASHTNATAIGYKATTTAANTIQLGGDGVVSGSTAITNVKTTGTITAGTVTYPNAHNSTAGQLLSINATGTAAWTTPASSGGGTHAIGEVYGGGIVFYVWDGGAHGLIASVADYPTKMSPNSGSLPGTSSNVYRNWNTDERDGILSGRVNTERIIAAQFNNGGSGGTGYNPTKPSAAKVAADYNNPTTYLTYTFESYGDWYLPSRTEMHLMALSRPSSNITLTLSATYSTSTEFSASPGSNQACYMEAIDANGIATQTSGYKDYFRSVRPIRSF